ncbi:hypothetical protein [Streptomyces sp. NPDC001889]
MSERTVPDPAASPAVLLGPTALFFGVVSVLGTAVPRLFFLTPFTALAGALALTFGMTGVRYGRRGVGRLWVAAAGAVLGLLGFGAFMSLLIAFAA